MGTKSEADGPHELRAVERRRAVQLIADRTLIEGVARRDTTAIESLVHRFAGRISCFFATRAVSSDGARRLTVDLLAEAIARASDYEGSAGIYLWLRRMAVQRLLEIHAEAHRRWPRYRNPLVDRLTPAELEWLARITRIDQIGFATRAADPPLESLREHIAELPRPQREVLLAYYGDDLGLEAISGRLHRGETALRSLLDQALSSLAKTNAMQPPATIPLRHNFLAAPRRERVTEIDLWTGSQAAPEELSLVADWLGLEESVHQVFHRCSITAGEVTLRRRLRPARNWKSWAVSAALTAGLAALASLQMRSIDGHFFGQVDRPSDVAARPELPGVDRPADALSSPAPADKDAAPSSNSSNSPEPSAVAGGRTDPKTSDGQWVPFGEGVLPGDRVLTGEDDGASSEPTWWDRPPEPGPALVPAVPPAAIERPRPAPTVPARQIDDLAAWRQRLYELVYARDWIALRDWTLGTEFQGSDTQRQWGRGLARWGAGMARVEGNPELIKTGKLALALVDRTHHQQTYDAMQEYYASLEGESDEEFSRLHRRFIPARYPGLIPWPGDSEQLVTVWGASELGGTLRPVPLAEESLAAARIDVARRLRSARPETVRELARQYAGTRAVGRVYEWMAERSLEAMRWADARQFIDMAGSADPDHDERWKAWRAVLERLQVPDVPRTVPVVDWRRSWGPPAVLPVEWWQGGDLAAANDEPAPAISGSSSVRNGVQPVRWEVRGEPVSTGLKWVDQPLGVDAVRTAQPDLHYTVAGQPWTGTSVQSMVYLSGPDACMAWDPIAGRTVWSYESPVRPLRPPAQSAGSPVRPPAIDGDHVVVTLGTQCYCLDRHSGELIWRTLLPANMQVVSAPVVRPDRYSWLALSTEEGHLAVHLLHLDPFTGQSLRSQELFRLRDNWYVYQQCELAEMGSYLAVSWGGATSVCDLDGNLYWVRETTAVQPSVDPYLGRVARQAPIISSTHVWAWQAGAPVVDCCELRTGRRVWRATLADLQRYVGGTAELLVFQLRNGLVGLDRETGKIVWQRNVSQSWGPISWENGAGQVLVVTQTAQTANDPLAWSAHWVNLADGRLVTSWPLDFGSRPVRVLGAVVWRPNGLAIAGVKVGESEVKIWSLAVRS